MINGLKNNHGIVYITALAMMLMFITYGLILSTVTQKDVVISQNTFKMLKDYYSAETGIEHAMGDIKNGGTGIVTADDLYSDNGGEDYHTTLDHMTSTLTSYSTYLPGTNRQIRTVINYKPVHAAFQVGNDILTTGPATGTINGSVDYGNSAPNPIGSLTVTGKLPTQPDPDIFIPTPDLTASGYQGAATYSYAGPVTWDWDGLSGEVPQGVGPYYPGIHFINGTLNVTAYSNFRIDGTIVATGGISFVSIPSSGLTLNPSGDNPAIVSGGSISMASCENLDIKGLIYAAGNISILTLAGVSNVINGAIVAGNDLTFNWATNLTINFDPNLDPPFFDSPTFGIKEWIGHAQIP